MRSTKTVGNSPQFTKKDTCTEVLRYTSINKAKIVTSIEVISITTVVTHRVCTRHHKI
jgi:hypothetical protein